MCLFPTHDVGLQPDGGDGKPVFRLNVGEGIKVVGLGHAADFGVVPSVVFVTDNFLPFSLPRLINDVEICP